MRLCNIARSVFQKDEGRNSVPGDDRGDVKCRKPKRSTPLEPDM